MELARHSLWLSDSLTGLQPRWVIDPQMMGGEVGNGHVTVDDGGTRIVHSFRSFCITRSLD